MSSGDLYSYHALMLQREAEWAAWEQQRTRLAVASWAAEHDCETAEVRAMLEMLGLIDYKRAKKVPSKNLRRREARKEARLTKASG